MQRRFEQASGKANRIPWSGVRRMFNQAGKHQGSINMSVGEPDFATPQHIIEAANGAMNKGCTHYTPNAGLIEFREAAAEKLKKENGIEASPEREVIATVGAMGALSLVMLVVANSGEEILIPNPGFASYEAQVLIADGTPARYPIKEADEFNINPEELNNLVNKRTRAILINSPSNPTGAVFDEKRLRRIAEIAIEHNLIVISDEAYEDIIYDEARHFSIASLPEMKKRTISIFSCSKTYSMTGWRIGFAAGNEKIISQMIKLQEHISAHPSSISQVAAVAALRGPKDSIKTWRKEYSERRDLTVKELNEMHGVRCIKPKGAFYVFPNIGAQNMSSEAFAMRILERARVVVVPGTAFGSNGEGYIRLSYATSREKIAEAMARMRRTLES